MADNQKITSLTGRKQQLSAGNLIGQHGGSERLSKSARKPKTSWTETRGFAYSPMSTTTYYSPLLQLQRLLAESSQFEKGDSCCGKVANFQINITVVCSINREQLCIFSTDEFIQKIKINKDYVKSAGHSADSHSPMSYLVQSANYRVSSLPWIILPILHPVLCTFCNRYHISKIWERERFQTSKVTFNVIQGHW